MNLTDIGLESVDWIAGVTELQGTLDNVMDYEN
jgi:hypothetical protein